MHISSITIVHIKFVNFKVQKIINSNSACKGIYDDGTFKQFWLKDYDEYKTSQIQCLQYNGSINMLAIAMMHIKVDICSSA